MALKQREKILVYVSGGLLAVAALYFAMTFIGGKTSLSMTELVRQRDAKAAELQRKQNTVRAGRRAAAKLVEWEKQSLPTPPENASAAYQKWLRDLVEKLKLRNVSITADKSTSRKGAFSLLTFHVEGRASLADVTKLLYEFYSAPHWHQIRRLTLAPQEKSSDLAVSMTIEAGSLPTVKRTDTLADGVAKRLAEPKLDDYLKTIVRRQMEGNRYVESGGLFAAYVPPAPPPVRPTGPPPVRPVDPPKPSFDHTQRAVLMAIVEVDGKPQIWIDVRTQGKRLKLGEGDSFEVGAAKGKVMHIGASDVEIVLEGKRRHVMLGDNLRDAKVVQGADKGTAKNGAKG